jgi:hypothetical protein
MAPSDWRPGPRQPPPREHTQRTDATHSQVDAQAARAEQNALRQRQRVPAAQRAWRPVRHRSLDRIRVRLASEIGDKVGLDLGHEDLPRIKSTRVAGSGTGLFVCIDQRPVEIHVLSSRQIEPGIHWIQCHFRKQRFTQPATLYKKSKNE